MDFVTLIVPRPSVAELMASFAKHCTDREAYTFNLIAHIDSIPLMETSHSYQATMDLVSSLANKFFDTFTIITTPTNKGHSLSFITCMRLVRHDYLYMEDDKLFIKDFTIDQYKKDGGHQYNLQDVRGNVGHTSSAFCRKELAAKMVELWPKEGVAAVRDVEHFYKRKFTYLREFKKGTYLGTIAADNGMSSTNSLRLVRRYVNGQLTYEQAPDVTVVTYISNPAAAIQWMASRDIRNWMLSMESYKHVVFVDADYPNITGYEVRRAYGPHDFRQQALNLPGPVVYINPYLRPYKLAKFTFNMRDELTKTEHSWGDAIENNAAKNAPERALPLMEVIKLQESSDTALQPCVPGVT